MINLIRNYYRKKPKQAIVLVLVIIWGLFNSIRVGMSNNTDLTRYFMKIRYYKLWELVDSSTKLYHYRDEWSESSGLNGVMHLETGKLIIDAYPYQMIHPNFLSKTSKKVRVHCRLSSSSENREVFMDLDQSLSKAYLESDKRIYLVDKNSAIVKEKSGQSLHLLRQNLSQMKSNYLQSLYRVRLIYFIWILGRTFFLILFIRWSGQTNPKRD